MSTSRNSPGSSAGPTAPWWGRRTWRKLYPGQGCPCWWSYYRTYPEPGRSFPHSERGLWWKNNQEGSQTEVGLCILNWLVFGTNIFVNLRGGGIWKQSRPTIGASFSLLRIGCVTAGFWCQDIPKAQRLQVQNHSKVPSFVLWNETPGKAQR